MASNRSVLDEAPYRSSGTGLGTATAYGVGFDAGTGARPTVGLGAEPDDPSLGKEAVWDEWNPTEESIAPLRGRHRVGKQRGGTMARSGAVLGVGVIAAVGAGGMASAKDRPTVPISMPDVAHVADEVKAQLPAAKDLPGIGSLMADDQDSAQTTATGLSTSGTEAGEALRTRILQQAESQQTAAEDDRRESEARAAAKAAADDAAKAAAKARDLAEQKKAEAAAKKKAAEAAKEKAEAEKKAAAAKAAADTPAKTSTSTGFTLPVASYTLTAGFGQAGDIWSADHTGQDFAAPTGTPVKAVSGGTVTQAGWAGSYGYRIVLKLDDGTEIWYCHLSSMVVTSGKVSSGETIGRVGATGNVTGPHLHLEVRPGGGSPIAPLTWLRDHGLNP
ncbi:putative peptidase [Streptomyces himastatinicus ATCC 53653]|uniref:Putative peptidase n=1 Tax=Streptomyces himastatinicus ATCC 53653 TaxID=457427 RepID=D9WUC8_9ACTN|nr:putative peptidase [Streptomyces himastatinicus ATCC 53653]